MKKFKINIDWKYITIELLIVIVGITIAFQLNNWNESRKRKSIESYFINSFYYENKDNLERIERLIKSSETFIMDVDTLVQIIVKDDYTDKRVKEKIPALYTMLIFEPNTLTLENLQSSYGLELIQDINLREHILKTYKSFSDCEISNESVINYSTSMMRPFLLNNIDINTSILLELNKKEKLAFKNIVYGYYYAWSEQLLMYKEVMKKIKLLDENLTTANN